MNEVESVRPTGGTILDLWDDMMRPFEQEESGSGNHGEDNLDRQEENGDETISLGEEEGIEVRIGKAE